jgi:MFS family permease
MSDSPGWVFIAFASTAVYAAGAALTVAFGFNAKSQTRRIRTWSLAAMFAAMSLASFFIGMGSRVDDEGGWIRRNDGAHVNWAQALVVLIQLAVLGGWFPLSVSTNISSALTGSALLGGSALFLLFGTLASGAFCWVSLIFAAVLMTAYMLLMFFWVPTDTTAVLDEAGQAIRVQANHYPSMWWIWGTRFMQIPFGLFLVVFLLDAPLFDIGEFSPVWAMLAYMLLCVGMGVLALVNFMFVNAEPEVAASVQGTAYVSLRNELAGRSAGGAPTASALHLNTHVQPHTADPSAFARSIASPLAATPAATYTSGTDGALL